MAHRIERMNSLIRQEISELLQNQVKDPRLGHFIAITEVDTSADFRRAKVFVSQIGNQEDKQKILKGLSSASGFFRSEMAKNLKMRYIPELNFIWDDSIEQGNHILQMIDEFSAGENL